MVRGNGFHALGRPSLVRRRGNPLTSYLTGLGVAIDWHLNEASGTTAQNYGSGGASGNGVNTNSIPINQTVGLRAGVYNFDDVDQNLAIANNALVETLTEAASLTLGFLCYPRTPNTSPFVGFGRVWARSSDTNHFALVNSATLLNAIQVTMDGVTTDATTTTTTGLTANAWQWLFIRFNLANSQLIDVLTYTGAGLVECTYSGTRTAMAGGPADVSAKTYNVGNQAANNRAVNWALARHFAIAAALTNDQLAQIGALTPGPI